MSVIQVVPHVLLLCSGTRRKLIYFYSILAVCLTVLPVYPQRPPVDMADMSLEQLLSLHVIRRVSGNGTTATNASAQPDWHIGYRYSRVEYDGYLEGTDNVSEQSLLVEPYNYRAVPNEIIHEAHVLEVSHDATERLALLLQVPYLIQRTPHLTAGDGFQIHTEGVGDITTVTMYEWQRWKRNRVFLIGGVSLPTGSINETGNTPRGDGVQVPYTMQLGSGTFDLIGGLSWQGSGQRIDWGSQVYCTTRLGRNARGYSLGDRCTASLWAAGDIGGGFRAGVKTVGQIWNDIDGHDRDLPASGEPAPAPVADPDQYGGERVDVIGMLACRLPVPGPSVYDLSVEWGVPVYQSLNGPQIEADKIANVSFTVSF